MKNCFRINEPSVVFEKCDGEVVVIHYETGKYFSIRNSGLQIWSWIADNPEILDTDKIVEFAVQYYSGVDETAVRQSTESFLAELVREELLVSVESTKPRASSQQPPSSSQSFEKPLLEVYDDMHDMILLDPVHEVSEKGWPHKSVPS